jgi:protocatechuate 3,4-dioxygenase beta subunit
MNRQLRALAAAALLVSSIPVGQAATQLAATPSQTEGPFYPRTTPPERDSDLTQVAGQPPAQGTRLYLAGRVLTVDGSPLQGATVELWQCDAFGRYHHVGDNGGPRDDGFQGFGATTTDAEGRYAFKTIRPVAYGGRIPHMHFKIRSSGGATLTTQLYVKGDAASGDPVLATSAAGTLAKLTVSLSPVAGRESGALTGTFDFVLPR